MPEKTNNLVGAAGEHYVCAELASNGYVALLTSKNNPLFDIVVTNQAGTKTVSIQVKTKAADNSQGWKLNKAMETKHENSRLFVVLVALKPKPKSKSDPIEAPDFYIYEHDLLSERVAYRYQKYIEKPKRDGTPRKDIDMRWYDINFFTDDDHQRKNNWEIITKELDATTP